MIQISDPLKKFIILTSILLFSVLGFFVWIKYAAPALLKVPIDFVYNADFVSVDNFFDEKSGEFSGEKYSNSIFSYHVVSQKNNIIEIQNNFEVRSFDGKKIFASSPIYGIDRKTWMHVKGYGDKNRGGYLFAPRGLKKDQAFDFWYVSTSVGANMKFVSEEKIYGLPVYKFEKTNLEPVDQSSFFTHLDGIPEKRGVRLINRLYLWIEPVSGYVVKQEEFSDDYYFFDQKTGEKLGTYNKFSNVFSEKSVIDHVNRARVEKYKVLVITYGIPLILFLVIFLPNILRYSYLNRTRKIELFGLVLAALLIIVALVFSYFINKNIIDSEQQVFADQADEIMLTLDRGFISYIDILRGTQGLLNASNFVDRSEWSSYVNNLDLEKKYPGVLSIGYAPVVDENRKDEFITTVQKSDLEKFAIFPKKLTPVYVPILYIEPQNQRTLGVIGYNFYSDESRSDALNRASKIKDLAVTSKIELLNEPANDKQPGFVMYLPIFRKPDEESTIVYTDREVVGYVFAAFRMNDLMKSILATKTSILSFRIFDGLRTTSDSLYFSYDKSVVPGVKTVFRRTDVLNIADRIWAVEFFNSPEYSIEKTKKSLPIVVFLAGVLVSILFYLVFYFLFTTKERALLIAENLTLSLKKSEESLKEKNNQLELQISESDKLNQIMIERELSMIELKKKMK